MTYHQVQSNDEIDGESEGLFHQELYETLLNLIIQGEEAKIRDLIRNNPPLKRSLTSFDEFDMSPFHYAARFGQLTCFQYLYEVEPTGMNLKNSKGLIPLHFAARYVRKNDEVQDLANQIRTTLSLRIKEGEKNDKKKKYLVEPKDFFVSTTIDNSLQQNLREATDGNYVFDPLIKFLKENGSQINEPDNLDMTALHYAAMKGNTAAVCEILTSSDALIGLDKYMMSPLHYAASSNHLEIVKILVEYNASIMEFDCQKNTPFSLAIKKGHWKIAEYFYQKFLEDNDETTLKDLISFLDSDGMIPLHYAIINGHFDCIKYTYIGKDLFNLPTSRGETSLHLAATRGLYFICDELINLGSEIDIQDNDGYTALHSSVVSRSVPTVKLLLENGADKSARNKNGLTSFLLAASINAFELIETFVEHDNPFDSVDRRSRNIVFIAAMYGSYKFLVEILKYAEAQTFIDKYDLNEMTPLAKAVELGYDDIVKVLLTNKARVDLTNERDENPLHVGCYKGNARVLELLCEKAGYLINSVNDEGKTPLHIASEVGYLKLVQILCLNKADKLILNSDQMNCLSIAASEGHDQIVDYLVSLGMDPNSKDCKKLPPLHWACKHGHVKVVNVLLPKGADPAFKVRPKDPLITDGSNALDIAIENGHLLCARAIIKNKIHFNSTMKNRIILPDGTYDTPLRKMIKNMPELAEEVFDMCITTNAHKTNGPDLWLEYNFEILDDTFADWGTKREEREGFNSLLSRLSKTEDKKVDHKSIYNENNTICANVLPYTRNKVQLKENHPLNLMVKYKRENLLDHSLVDALMIMKWNEYGFLVYILNFLFYLLFLGVFTIFILTSTPPYQAILEVANSTLDKIRTECPGIIKPDNYQTVSISKYILVIISILNLIKEALQFVTNPKGYVGYENLIELTLYISTCLVAIDFSKCSERTSIRQDWQWELATMAIFLTWSNLLLFAQKIPNYGIYVILVIKVSKTFMKFSGIFILFLSTYSITFHALFAGKEQFTTLRLAYIKTGVMMLGEIEYDQLFENVPYKVVSYIVFVSFMIIMCVIMMNLMVGLAVDDIKSVLDEAKLNRLAKQVSMCLDVESLMPMSFKRKHVHRNYTVYPNRKFDYKLTKFFHSLYTPKAPKHCEPLSSRDMSTKDAEEVLKEVRFLLNEIKQNMNDVQARK